jgi:HAE1 family hydrophobic/amphiphilic exporter-1
MADFFIRRPIVAMVISIILVLVGGLSLMKLPISQYPEITPPEIQVTTTYLGANAINVEEAVATPIEQQVNGVEKMLYMRSVNASDGTMMLRVTFDVGTNLDMANVLTQNRVSQAEAVLPAETKAYGVNIKKSLTFPLLLVSVSSPNGSFDKQFIDNYANINIVDALARIRDVGQVTPFGGSLYAMRIWIKPDILAKLDITTNDIAKAIGDQNIITPGGKFGGPPTAPGTETTYTIALTERLKTQEEFENIILRQTEGGGKVRIKDVARIELGQDNYNGTARLNGKDCATLAIYQIPGSNALEVADNIKAKMAELSERFPQDLKYDVSLDTTLAITAGIDEIIHTLLEALVLVIVVVFLFLQNWRATLIPLIVVPVSLIATFAIFPLLGFSINVLSLLGMVLAIGIVVDDAIVVVEAVMHGIEHGLTPKEATRKAMKEVTEPVIGITLVLAGVFVPVAMIAGITGLLYQQFAITIAISVLFSAINALTLTPALCALMLKPHQESKGWLGKFFKGFNKWFDKVTGKYEGVAGVMIRKTTRSLILIGVMVGFILFMGKTIPTGFVPEEDMGYFMVNVQLPDAASLERTEEVSRKVEQLLSKVEGVEYVTVVTGYSLLTGANNVSNAFLFIGCKEWQSRGTVKEMIKKANGLFATQITEATVFAFGPPAIPGLGSGSGFCIMLQDRSGSSPQYLATHTQRFLEAAKQRPELMQVNTTYRANVPQYRIEVDKDKVLKKKVVLSEVYNTIGTYLGARYINDFNRFGKVYKVMVQAEGEKRLSESDLNQYFVRSTEGEMVPVSALVNVIKVNNPEITNRFNMYRSAEVRGEPAPGYSSDQALDALEEVAKEVLPIDVGYEWRDMSYQERKAAGSAGVIFVMSIIFVFLILAALYESWSLPFSVLLGTPFAILGAFGGIYIMRFFSESYLNNVFAQIGLIMLVGLAAKNAILIVEFAKMQHEQHGKPIVEAALEAAKLRLRPIIMTSFAFILGVVPLLTAYGAGAEARKVMGVAVFSGMLIATILGVLLVPMLYVLIEKINARFGGKKPVAEKGGPTHE